MSHTTPGKVDMDGSAPDVVIELTMSDNTAARLVHAVRARLPEAAPSPTIEMAVLMALTWSKQGNVRPPS